MVNCSIDYSEVSCSLSFDSFNLNSFLSDIKIGILDDSWFHLIGVFYLSFCSKAVLSSKQRCVYCSQQTDGFYFWSIQSAYVFRLENWNHWYLKLFNCSQVVLLFVFSVTFCILIIWFGVSFYSLSVMLCSLLSSVQSTTSCI